MTCCDARIKSLENISTWKYQGNDFLMHGPYDSLLMLKWISQGYFDESTIVQNVKFASKMPLKMAVINLKEDAIKYAQSILSCPHHDTHLYSINETTNIYTNPETNKRPESVSTCDQSATSAYSIDNVPIVYRNVQGIDTHINDNTQTDKDMTINNKIEYCDTHMGQFEELRKDESYLQNAMFFPQLHDTISELSPEILDKSVGTTTKLRRTTGIETIFGLNEAEKHLKRIEKHKISSYLEKIMCMGNDIHIVGQLN